MLGQLRYSCRCARYTQFTVWSVIWDGFKANFQYLKEKKNSWEYVFWACSECYSNKQCLTKFTLMNELCLLISSSPIPRIKFHWKSPPNRCSWASCFRIISSAWQPPRKRAPNHTNVCIPTFFSYRRSNQVFHFKYPTEHTKRLPERESTLNLAWYFIRSENLPKPATRKS